MAITYDKSSHNNMLNTPNGRQGPTDNGPIFTNLQNYNQNIASTTKGGGSYIMEGTQEKSNKVEEWYNDFLHTPMQFKTQLRDAINTYFELAKSQDLDSPTFN